MKRAFLRQHGKGGLELIEEAFVLLRSSSAATLAMYYLGSAPFVAGFLIFWSDFGSNPHAADHLGSATLAVTGLFVWMKFFHARFGGMLLAELCRGDPPAWNLRGVARSVAHQTIVQSTALFVLPLAAIIALPFGWVFAYYQNVTALDDGGTGLKILSKNAREQCMLWPVQNHLLIMVLSGFGFVVFVNWLTLGFLAPQLLKMFFGIESVFTRSPASMLNTTFFAAMAALTYLSVDPLIKACYVLRCFYGKSLQSGDDLKTELRRFSGRVTAFALCLLLCLGGAGRVSAEPAPPPAIAGPDLDRSISTVIQQDKYTWRLPREKAAAKEGVLMSFLRSIGKMFKTAFKWLGDLINKIIDWIRGRDRGASPSGESPGWMTPQISLLFVTLAAAAALLALAAMRMVRARRRSAGVESSALPAVPDIEDENTAADELPEDDWTRLGRQFLERGDDRLALRAFYLAGLAHLASRGLITIARSKSNRDYERELGRRGHAMPELPVLFGENVGIFDRIWYGLHEVNPALVEHFVANLNRIKIAG